MRPFWLHPSSLLCVCRHSPLLSGCPHPPLSFFCFSVSPAVSLFCKSVGVDGVMWLQISLWAWKAVLSVQQLVKYVWSPDVICDLNVTVRFHHDYKAVSDFSNLRVCLFISHMWSNLKYTTYTCFLPPQTPDSWTDKSQNRRSSSSHKRSASWGSAENLREVNLCLYCSTCMAKKKETGLLNRMFFECLYEKGQALEKAWLNYLDSIEQQWRSDDLICNETSTFSLGSHSSSHRL